jgi:6-phosphogluconolactonase
VTPGYGPRHFDFHPSNRYAYLINEIGSTLTAFSYDPEGGVLQEIETVPTLPDGFDGRNSTADVHVHPNGKFLYGSNRGHNSIVIYAIDEATGKISLVGHESTQGEVPRNFGIDPTGRILLAANQNTDNVVTFWIDQTTGKLTPTGHSTEVPTPVCLKMVPADA